MVRQADAHGFIESEGISLSRYFRRAGCSLIGERRHVRGLPRRWKQEKDQRKKAETLTPRPISLGLLHFTPPYHLSLLEKGMVSNDPVISSFAAKENNAKKNK